MPQIFFSGSEFSTIALRRTVSRLCPNVWDIKGTGQFLNASSLDFGSCDKCTTLKRLCIVFLLLQGQNSELYIYSFISVCFKLLSTSIFGTTLLNVCAYMNLYKSVSIYVYRYVQEYMEVYVWVCFCGWKFTLELKEI